MMTVQALWTAANENIPVVYLICNNRSYRILKINMDSLQDAGAGGAATGRIRGHGLPPAPEYCGNSQCHGSLRTYHQKTRRNWRRPSGKRWS